MNVSSLRTAISAVLMLAMSGLFVVAIAQSADARTCASRVTELYQGYDDYAHKEMVGRVKATCSGGGSLDIELKIMEHKSFAPDQQVAKTKWDNWAGLGLYKTLRACDDDDGRFYAQSYIENHGDQQSDADPWDDCDKD